MTGKQFPEKALFAQFIYISILSRLKLIHQPTLINYSLQLSVMIIFYSLMTVH